MSNTEDAKRHCDRQFTVPKSDAIKNSVNSVAKTRKAGIYAYVRITSEVEADSIAILPVHCEADEAASSRSVCDIPSSMYTEPDN